jgi:hypothetical protein
VKEGDLFYYAHLDRESALPLGASIRAGQLVGYAGDTGQGPEVTRGLFPPHLHFGWYDATGTRSYLPSGAMNPYPLLEWLKAGGGVLGGGMDARYCEVPRSGAPQPSTGGDRWPSAREPGARPDLDTGTRGPAPSPAVERARPPVRQAAQPEKATPAEAAPDRRQGASRPPAAGGAGTGNPGEPAPRAEPPLREPDAGSDPGSNPGADPGQPAAGQSPKDGPDVPGTSPENQPPGEGSDPPDEEPDPGNGEPGESEGPDGGSGGQDPARPGAGKEEPEEEEPEGKVPESDEDRPDEVTAADGEDTASEPQPDEDPEEPPQETTTEATTAE